MQNAIGSIMDPFTSFLALRGVKTLPLRMEQHCAQRPGDRALAGCAIPRPSG